MKRRPEVQGDLSSESDPNGLTGDGAPSRASAASLAAGPFVLLLAAGVMAWRTWGAWPDVLVDFGQQLYLPWQITEGRALYADLAYYNGPLSPYLNALAFHLFGVGLRTLVVLNLFWLGLLVCLLHHVFTLAGGRFAAFAACLVFLLLFAFGQYVGIGNYNYVCPYAHEMTHGLLLSLAAIVCVWHSFRQGSGMLAAGGLLLGLAFLTKAEVFVAAAAGALAALVLGLLKRGDDRPLRPRDAGRFLAGFLAPPLLAFLLLSLGMPAGRALEGTLGSWVAVVNPELGSLPFFRAGLGLTDVRGNLGLMAAWTGGYAACVVPIALLGLAAGKARSREILSAGLTMVVLSGTLWVFRDAVAWRQAARGFPAALGILGAALAVRFFRPRNGIAARERLIRQISLVAFALALLGKMVLNVRIYHYGFVLAMPATLVLVVALVGWIPSAIRRYGGSAKVFRAGASVLIGGLVFAYLGMQGDILARKDRWVAGPFGDRLRADPVRGELVNKALEVFPAMIREGHTVAALPEGVMLNYLLRRPNPTPYTNFMPTEMILYGEEKMLDAFRANPPDWISLVHKDTSEFGFRFFGQDYGKALFAWIMEAYEPVGVVGAMPLATQQHGILLMKRKEPQGRQAHPLK
jgi:hypothetical protein